jgi:YedE family putative selenium metabolism protein
MIGALVFLGCPWRALLRLSGGDGNAILGIAGLVFGIFIGTIFIRKGFTLGRTKKTYPIVGLVLPIFMIGLLILFLWDPTYDDGGKILFKSTTGPGSMYAPVALSLGIAIAVGFFAQRTRFCTVGGVRDSLLIKDYHLLLGVIALVIAAFIANLILDQFNPGFEEQPVAHNDYLWNFMGMALAGLAFILAGGCPGRNLVLSGEGNADSSVFVFGMIAGAAFSHNFRLASSPAGIGDWGAAAVILGLIVCLVIGFSMREKA